MKLQRISIELAVFLMIALVAFGGFISTPLSQSDDLNNEIDEAGDSGNELTGDASWRKKLKKAVAAPFKKIEAEAKRVETKVSNEFDRFGKRIVTAGVKAASYPIRKPGSYAKNAQDIKRMTQTVGVITAIVSGIPMFSQDAPPDAKMVQTYSKSNPPQGWQGQWPANNPTIQVDQSTVALWGQQGHGGATSARDLLTNPDSYAANIVQNEKGEIAYKWPNAGVPPKDRWFPPMG
jgi:hypothetical protein